MTPADTLMTRRRLALAAAIAALIIAAFVALTLHGIGDME